MTYEEIIRQVGKQLECEFYSIKYHPYVSSRLQNDDVKSVKISFNAPLIGTVMKQVEIETKKRIDTEIPLNEIGDCSLVIFASYDGNKASKWYDFLYIKEEPTYNADTRTYTYILGDAMIKLMKEYKPINITYPTTISDFAQVLITSQGLYVNDQNFALPNGSIVLEKDPYEGISNFTYRDALDDIAQANGVLFGFDRKYLNIVNYKNREKKTINDDILKSQNISMGEHYGAINTLVLSRSAESDNVYYPAELPAKPIEYKIIDNILMNENNRADFMPKIFENIQGVEYDIYDCELVGYGNFEPLDPIKIETLYDGNLLTYQSYVFNYEVTISDGYNEAIYAEKPENTNTDYTVASTDDRMMKNVSLIVDKKNNEIKAVVAEEIGKTNSKVASLEATVDDVSIKVDEVIGGLEKTETFAEGYQIKIIDIEKDAILRFKWTSSFSRKEGPFSHMRITLSSKPNFYSFPEFIVYQEEIEFPTNYDVYIDDGDFINYDVVKKGSPEAPEWTLQFHRYNSDIVETIKWPANTISNPALSELWITLETKEGTSWIGHPDHAEWVITYSTVGNFVTQEQLSSAITVASNEINLSVDGKLETVNGEITDVKGDLDLKVGVNDYDQVVSMLNASFDEINLKSNRFSMESTYSTIKNNGEVSFTGGIIGGWHISETSLYCEIKPPYDYTASDRDKIQQYIEGKIALTNQEKIKYDINQDGTVNILDLNLCNKLITYNIMNSNPGKLLFDTSDWFKPIKIINSSGEILAYFGVNGVWTKPLS